MRFLLGVGALSDYDPACTHPVTLPISYMTEVGWRSAHLCVRCEAEFLFESQQVDISYGRVA